MFNKVGIRPNNQSMTENVLKIAMGNVGKLRQGSCGAFALLLQKKYLIYCSVHSNSHMDKSPRRGVSPHTYSVRV